MHLLTPPTPLTLPSGQPSLFLAGSIEMGKAIDWQTAVINDLAHTPITILNPRRDEWDSSWAQTIDNPPFREQVEWELEAQERCDLIAMYFSPETKAPITLLELGLFARSQKIIVACPEGYWRKGNVEVVCARYHIPLYPDLASLVMAVKQTLAL